MYYYFTGNYDYAVRINGLYFGVIGKEPKPISIDSPSPLIELCPINGGVNLNFILDEAFLSSPVSPVKITDMKGGYLIDFSCPKNNLPFKVVYQKRFNNFEITLFYDGAKKLSIQTESDYFVENAEYFSPEINSFSVGGIDFVYFIDRKENKRYLSLYKTTEKTEKIFCGEITDFSYKDKISLSYSLPDVLKHKIEITFSVNGNTVFESERKVSRAKNPKDLNEKIIPFAFFEELCVGSDVYEYLSEEMHDNAPYLKEYLKDFIGVMPPPFFRDINEVGLIRKKSDNAFFVDYYIAEVKDKKIINLKKSE